jgi:hypothetical protein
VVAIGQTSGFGALMMILLRVGNKNAAGWMSEAAPGSNRGETWKPF